RVAKISALVVPIAGIAMQVSFLTVLGVGGFRVASGAIDIASLVAFILFLFMMIMPLGQAFGAFTSVNQALGALGRIQEIIDTPSEDEADAAVTPSPAVETTDAITFENVEFRYPEAAHKTEAEKVLAEMGVDGNPLPSTDNPLAELVEAGPSDRTVLRGVTFSVPRGQRIALVGP